VAIGLSVSASWGVVINIPAYQKNTGARPVLVCNRDNRSGLTIQISFSCLGPGLCNECGMVSPVVFLFFSVFKGRYLGG